MKIFGPLSFSILKSRVYSSVIHLNFSKELEDDDGEGVSQHLTSHTLGQVLFQVLSMCELT